MNIPSYYNTNKVSGQTLLDFQSSAKSQEELILTVFKMAFRPLAWFEVKRLLVEDMNEVSIKRSITNLKKRGILERTNELIDGIYKKPCHKYKIV